jgi:hypothetical protein
MAETVHANNELLEKVNRFQVRCEGCQHSYQSAIIQGIKKLLHAKVDVDNIQNATLPTPHCVLSYDYVRFDPCNHCCPEVFELCPESHTTTAGKPTSENCSG